MNIGKGSCDRPLSEGEMEQLWRAYCEKQDFSGKNILAIIPDTTRSGPTHFFFRLLCETLSEKGKKLSFMLALGTHPPLSTERLNCHLQIDKVDRRYLSKVTVHQHHWDDPEQLLHIGTISAREMKEISSGLMSEEIPVTVNKLVKEFDVILLVGPVFPHEVVGFSGGYKYLFPGISGPDFLHRFHWLGALITNPKINGTKDTPVRAALNRAASFLPVPTHQLCYVVRKKKVFGFFAGGKDAWSKAADLSAKLNVTYVEKSYRTVLSVAPTMYEDIWTAGKCMYKLEPVVADGGTLIIYAPHVREVSHTHGEQIRKVGYHTRDYFLKQWEKFKDVPGCILAHSTHVKGIGTYRNGVEKPRIQVVLATGIPERVCRQINLGYLNPESINPRDYAGREEEGILLVPEAGEVLFRLSDGSVPDIDLLYK